MNFGKLVLPAMILLVIIVIYLSFFAPKDTLGSFDSFDTNSNANLDIRVEIVKEKGIQKDQSQGAIIFYARDKNGREVLVSAPNNTPDKINNSEVVVLHGHLHTDHFHATEVKF